MLAQAGINAELLESISNDNIPKDLEIVIGSNQGGQFGSTSRLIIRDDRIIESSSYEGGGLPKSRSFSDLLGILRIGSDSNKDYAKRKKKYEDEVRKARTNLKKRVPKKTLRLILKKFVETRFLEMDPELMCRNKRNEPANFVTHSSSKWVSLTYGSYSLTHSAIRGCGPISGELVTHRERLYTLYDFILENLKNVRRNHVPWRSDIERRLRSSMEGGGIPDDFEILIESDDGGLGSRFRLKSDRSLNKHGTRREL